ARLDRDAVCLRALDGALGRGSQRQGAARGDTVRWVGRWGRGPVPGCRAARRPAHAAAPYCYVYSGLSLLYRKVRTAGHRPVSALPATARLNSQWLVASGWWLVQNKSSLTTDH